MALCHEYGIGHSQWMKWEPSDRDKALAWLEYQGSLCHKCGTDPNEWLDEKGRLIEPLPYVASSVICHGCATLEEARASVTDKDKAQVINHSLRKVSRKIAGRIHGKWQMSRSK